MSICKAAYPDLPSSELREKARLVEESAFKTASSKENYNDLWHQTLRALQSHPQSSELLPAERNDNFAVSDAPPQQIGPYTATYHQSGLFSTIFRAKDSSMPLTSFVALKLTTPSQTSPPHNSIREARLLSLTEHSRIIPLLSTSHRPGGHFILVFPFMPYTLEDLLRQGRLTVAQLQSHLHDLFAALTHIHSIGIIHRDVKPSNILLASPSGPAHLADFGIAWKDGDPDSEPAGRKITDVGTASYRPPELLFGDASYGNSLDLWSAGCVVAEALVVGHNTLFDAGPMGSELALIHSIFKTLGTPTLDTWPEAAHLPDWGKMQFYEYPPRPWAELLPDVDDTARNLVLEHPFFHA